MSAPPNASSADPMTLALQAHQAGRHEEAVTLYRARLDQAPDDYQALNNLGWLLYRLRQGAAAAEALTRSVALAPTELHPRLGLGYVLQMLGRLEEAEAQFRHVLSLSGGHEGASLALGYIRLALGDYGQGLPLYELRADRQAAWPRTTLPLPEWRGEPLAGKRLLVWREQGFGDQIQMARFIPQLGAAHITYAGLPPLRRLFAGLPLEFLEVSGQAVIDGHDYWTLPLSWPYLLGVTPETLPAPPYLFGQRAWNGGIGVMTRGNAVPDPGRSIPEDVAAPIYALPGAIDLDPARTGARDFQDTADLITGLDLVITIDTALAHLAGALDVPVFILAPFLHTDWRWGASGASTPWYPSARIYRQTAPDDWREAVAAVLADAA